MFQYLLRRLLLSLVNLVVISMVVFLLGRFLPTAVSDTQVSDGTSGAMEPALRQWQEQRFGLDRPLHEQYVQWCRGMFVHPAEVMLWTHEQPARPLYRIANAAGHDLFVVQGPDNAWVVFEPVGDDDAKSGILELDDAEVATRLTENDLKLLRRLRDRGQSPRVQFIAGSAGRTIDKEQRVHVHRESHSIDRMQVTLGWSSKTNRSVWTEFRKRLPVTAAIGVLSMALMYGLAILLGTISAAHSGGFFDRWTSRCMLLIWSAPIVLTATLLLGWLAGELDLFPPGGVSSADAESMSCITWLVDRLWHLALPVLVLALPGAAYLTRQVRAAVLEQMNTDFVRTARAKGLTHGQIIARHAMRPAMLVVVTLAATVLPVVIGGSVLVESIFGIDGMGRFVYQAVVSRDYDVVQAFTLIAAASNMIGLLLADGLSCLIDPRIRFASGDRSS